MSAAFTRQRSAVRACHRLLEIILVGKQFLSMEICCFPKQIFHLKFQNLYRQVWTEIAPNGQTDNTIIAHLFCALPFLALFRYLVIKNVHMVNIGALILVRVLVLINSCLGVYLLIYEKAPKTSGFDTTQLNLFVS
jgi:hypothetical protein